MADPRPARPDPGKFVSDGSGVVLTQCLSCRHKVPGMLWACAAFPSAIPPEIVANEFDHRRPYPGDDGVRFAPRPDVPAAYLGGLERALDDLAP